MMDFTYEEIKSLIVSITSRKTFRKTKRVYRKRWNREPNIKAKLANRADQNLVINV